MCRDGGVEGRKGVVYGGGKRIRGQRASQWND